MMRTFKAENGHTLIALDDTQADAMIKSGLTEVLEATNIEVTNTVVEIKIDAPKKEVRSNKPKRGKRP